MLACVAISLPAVAACYQLFDKKDRLVLQSTTPPVDLSKPLSDEVGRLYPGHYLIMGGGGPCVELDELNRAVVKLPAESLNRGPIRIAPESDELPYVPPPATYSGAPATLGAGGSSYRSPPGTDVRVRSYTRGDGTIVRAHTRARPGSGSKR